MKRRPRFPLLVWLVIACLVLLLLPAGPACAFSGVTITEHTGLTDTNQPRFIAAGPDGAMWFTESTGDRIGRIAVLGDIAEYGAGIPPGSYPTDIAAGPDGAMWFTEIVGNRIGLSLVAGCYPELPR